MQQPPIFQTTCKDGKLVVDQMNISIMAPFNKLVWSIPRSSVTSIVQKPGFLSTEVVVYSAHGVYLVQTLPKAKANELVALFPPQGVPIPQGIPIDAELQRIKMEIEQRRLQLSQINTNMATIRSHYQQSHLHGGGKLGSVVRGVQQSSKDAKLKKQQPTKERLQREKLALEQQLAQLKLLKAQGITHLTSPIKVK